MMIGLGVSPVLPNLATGSSVPAGTVTRTPRGSVGSTEGFALVQTLPGVSVDAGCWLLVAYAFSNPDGADLASIKLGTTALSLIESQAGGAGEELHLYGKHFAAAASGTVTAQHNESSDGPAARAMVAIQVSGLAEDAVDKTADDAGSGTTISSGLTAETSQAHEYVVGLATVVHTSAAIAWTEASGLSAGYSQVQGILDEPLGDLIELNEGYDVTTVAAAQKAEATVQSNLWTAIVATFKAAA